MLLSTNLQIIGCNAADIEVRKIILTLNIKILKNFSCHFLNKCEISYPTKKKGHNSNFKHNSNFLDKLDQNLFSY